MTFLSRHKQSVGFLAIVASLSALAIGAAIIADVADRRGKYELASVSAKFAIAVAVIIVLYVVAKLVQNVSRHADITLQITNSGLVFSALIFLVAILSLSSGNNLLYLVLSVLVATMFVSLVGSRLSLSRLFVSIRFPDHIFVEERVPFDVRVTNRKRLLPAFSIGVAAPEESELRTEGANLTELAYVPILPARTESRTRIERSFAKRGVFRVRGILVGTRFPLGFIEQRRLIATDSEVVVYPRPLPPEEFVPLLVETQGKAESRAKGSGSDLHAIRQYLASDHHHHIDWKATAKTARLMVREFTRDDDSPVTIVFDNRVDPDLALEETFDRKFEHAVSLAAGLVKEFIDRSVEVRLLAGRDDSGFGCGERHLYAMLRLLAVIVPTTEADAARQDFSPMQWSDNQFRILIAPGASKREFAIGARPQPAFAGGPAPSIP